MYFPTFPYTAYMALGGAQPAQAKKQSTADKYGVKPLDFDPEGNIVMTPAQRSQGTAAAMAALGAGLMMGASTASWEGLGQGIAQGFAGATEAANKSREDYNARKITEAQVRSRGAQDELAIKSAEFNYDSAVESKQKQDEYAKRVREGVGFIFDDMYKEIDKITVDSIKSVDPNPKYDVDTESGLSAYKNLLKAQLLTARAGIETGYDVSGGMTSIDAISEMLPNVAALKSTWAARIQGRSETEKKKTTNEGTAGIASQFGEKTYLDENAEVKVLNKFKQQEYDLRSAQIKNANAQTKALKAGSIPNQQIQDNDIIALNARMNTNRELLGKSAGSLTNTAMTVGTKLKNRFPTFAESGATDLDLLREFATPGSAVQKAFSSSGKDGVYISMLQEAGSLMGIDQSHIPSNDVGILQTELRKKIEEAEGVFNRLGIVRDRTTGQYNIDINNPNELELAIQRAHQDEMDSLYNGPKSQVRIKSWVDTYLTPADINQIRSQFSGINDMFALVGRGQPTVIAEIAIRIQNEAHKNDKERLDPALQRYEFKNIQSQILENMRSISLSNGWD